MSAYSSPSSLLSAPSLLISAPVCSLKYFSRTFSRFCLPGPPLRGTKVPSHFRSRLATAVSRRGSYRDFVPFRKHRVFRSRIPSSKGIFASLRIPTVPRCFDMFSFLPEMQQTIVFWLSVLTASFFFLLHVGQKFVIYRDASPATTAQLIKIASVSPTFVFLIRVVVCKKSVAN